MTSTRAGWGVRGAGMVRPGPGSGASGAPQTEAGRHSGDRRAAAVPRAPDASTRRGRTHDVSASRVRWPGRAVGAGAERASDGRRAGLHDKCRHRRRYTTPACRMSPQATFDTLRACPDALEILPSRSQRAGDCTKRGPQGGTMAGVAGYRRHQQHLSRCQVRGGSPTAIHRRRGAGGRGQRRSHRRRRKLPTERSEAYRPPCS